MAINNLEEIVRTVLAEKEVFYFKIAISTFGNLSKYHVPAHNMGEARSRI